MYPTYYGLKGKPFSTSSAPQSLWFGEAYKTAISKLEFGILEQHGLLLLTGDKGSGKSALVNFLFTKIDVTSVTITISDTEMTSVEFLNCLAENFKIGKNYFNKGAFLIHLKDILYSAYSTNKKVLLIIKDAQNLSHQLLEEIRLLSNFEIDGKQLLNILFVAQSEFIQFLMKEKNRPLYQRITMKCHLDPLSKWETLQYINQRLKNFGAKGKIFSSDAVSEIYSFTGGNPRLIDGICNLSLSKGAARNAKPIDVDIIKDSENSAQITSCAGRAKNKKLIIDPVNKLLTLPPPPKILFVILFILLFSTTGYLIYHIQ